MSSTTPAPPPKKPLFFLFSPNSFFAETTNGCWVSSRHSMHCSLPYDHFIRGLEANNQATGLKRSNGSNKTHYSSVHAKNRAFSNLFSFVIVSKDQITTKHPTYTQIRKLKAIYGVKLVCIHTFSPES